MRPQSLRSVVSQGRVRITSKVKQLQPSSRSSRCGHIQWRRFASRTEGKVEEGKPKEGNSFQGQLYNSTYERLLRERAEQARFAQHRQLGSGGWPLQMAFGMGSNVTREHGHSMTEAMETQWFSRPSALGTIYDPSAIRRVLRTAPRRRSVASHLSNTKRKRRIWSLRG